jgi:predicted NBD/HSP70 family sugar kinase
MWTDKEIDNVIYLSLSNSVGGSIILRDNLFTGENQRAGEFGHMTLVKGGLPCYCGKKGCVDAYCSAQVLSRHSDENLSKFFEILKGGEDNGIKLVWEQYLSWLATVINSLVTAFDCRIILGGYLGEYLDEWADKIRKMVAELSTFMGNENYVSICKFKRDSAAVGAALLYVRKFIFEI